MIAAAPAQPGETIGIMGGGQLGRMLALSGASMGFDIRVLDPDPDAPAMRVAAEGIAASFVDDEALTRFADGLKFATCEFENVPRRALERVAAAGVELRPDPTAFACASDREQEKRLFANVGIPCVEWIPVHAGVDLLCEDRPLPLPGILKTSTMGYDGKGQALVGSREEAKAAFARMGGVRCIVEKRIELRAEVSVLIARGANGDVVVFDCVRNVHENGILRTSDVPTGLSKAIEHTAAAHARRLVETLGYVGLLALEFLVDHEDRVIANEFAPRVHNSGHWTIDACLCSQFDAHMRAVAGWPLVSPARLADVRMTNLIGVEADDWRRWADVPDARIHLYGKRQTRPGRKMGHVNVLRNPQPRAR